MQVPSLGWEDPLEEDMTTHPSILVWRITKTGEPGRLLSIGLKRHDLTEVASTPYCRKHLDRS